MGIPVIGASGYLSAGLVILLSLFHISTTSATTAATRDGGMCRSKSLLLEPRLFELHSCAWCYQYAARSDSIRAHPTQPYLYVINNRTSLPSDASVLVPDVTNASDVKRVCSTVPSAICERWQECCHAARRCCQRQLQAGHQVNGTCARTWDGWSCWDDTPAGTVEYVSCPTFFRYPVLSIFCCCYVGDVAMCAGYGKKTCLENGTWFSRYLPGANGSQGRFVEWTDYTTCIDKKQMMTSLYLALGCNACSIVFLIPSLLIFLLYRSLRRQHRIRLHINFFGALLLSNIMSILWDVVVTHDRITSDANDSVPVINANGVDCKLLAFLRLYFKSTTYVWMFCEGFYLHRLISNAFRPPKSLIFLYASGWGVPLVCSVLYVILRVIYANDGCWAKSFGNLEWIIYTPNLFCLFVNLFFLCNILRVLLTQLQTHPNEPSNFRRALKATFVLIPLFGAQLFVTVYRLPAGQPGGAEYEQFTAFVTNSQCNCFLADKMMYYVAFCLSNKPCGKSPQPDSIHGFFVALIFCFFNGEVIAQMKRTCARLNILRVGTETSRATTYATSVHNRDDSHESENGGNHLGMLHNHHDGSGGTKSINGKRYSAMETADRKHAYIPMQTRKVKGDHTSV